MKNASLHHAEYLDRKALDTELVRVFEKCHDCRRCLPLCPSFPSLFDAIDSHDLEAAKLTGPEIREVIDLCFQCKLCYNHCPYHPPHEWAIDFPKLMSRAKLVQAKEEGIPLAERIGSQQDLMGKAFVPNRGHHQRRVQEPGGPLPDGEGNRHRPALDHADLRIPPVLERPPATRTVSGENGRAILFTTCFVEYSEAFGPQGVYGAWLRRRPAAVIVGDTLFPQTD